jgi:NAD(P)-dependent dehydrogenase (short-subunit alcohol dehydrogenase family)
VRADVTCAADNQMVVEKAVATWGRLDVFFANAGVPQSPQNVRMSTRRLRPTGGQRQSVWLGAVRPPIEEAAARVF